VMHRSFLVCAVAGAVLVAVFPVRAALILPGGSTTSQTGASGDLGANTLLASLTAPLTAPTFTATVREAVVRETLTGNLTFLYQLSDSAASLDTLRRLTGSKYDSVSTDVFVATTNLPALFTAGTAGYATADRSLESPTVGNVIGFNFDTSGANSV